jgi:catechol 2,3-dioxygenase
MNSAFFQHASWAEARLRVRSVAATLPFYRDLLGFRVIAEDEQRAELSANGRLPALIILQPDPGATGRVAGSPGLFHLAFLFPHRAALATAVLRLGQDAYPLDGASDHGVSEAIYLTDPEGNGLELYADRPESLWPRQGDEVEMGTKRLALGDLLATGHPSLPAYTIPDATRLGHVHLQVADLAQARQAVTDQLGMKIRQQNYAGALFYAYDGYHHHLATNTWGVTRTADSRSLGLAGVTLRVSAALSAQEPKSEVTLGGVALRIERAGI